MVIGMRERSKKAYPNSNKREKPGRVKFVHVPDGKKESIKAAVDAHVSPWVDRIYTDSAVV